MIPKHNFYFRHRLVKTGLAACTGGPANILPNSVTHEVAIRAKATLCLEPERQVRLVIERRFGHLDECAIARTCVGHQL
ncbi:hypothetical protein [Caballeronia sp. AAUFL_F1_KS47]|uniref:hypothetical protein n=1 Tax=Caballeronia sp. AAUFL_F1_KS47 TaxID=2921771 RepID=UPI0020293E66|nr:hypothetical protein [Caballeronia sp. AAUFL_F1_KS47]